jgi:hypothetical protein
MHNPVVSARTPALVLDPGVVVSTKNLAKKAVPLVKPPPNSGLSEVAQVEALYDVGPLLGGSMPHLVRCSDRNLYVVKFLNNPQGPRVLANELFSFHLASLMGLPIFPSAIVGVDKAILELNPSMSLTRKAMGGSQCQPGLAFGSRYESPFTVPLRLSTESERLTLPPIMYHLVENNHSFLGMLVFDNWVMNSDWRQVNYLSRNRARSFRVYMIDNGMAFLGGRWNLPNTDKYVHPNLCPNRHAYRFAKTMDAFEPWLAKLETGITLSMLKSIAMTIPESWCVGEQGSLSELVEKLDQRRTMVRDVMLQKYFTLGCAPNLTYRFGCSLE